VSTTSCERPERTLFGIESAIDLSLAPALDLLDEPCGRLHLEHVAERGTDFVRARASKARHMRRSVPNWLISRGCSEPLTVLEQERRAARLDRAIHDLGDLEVRIDLGRDALQLALALEQGDPGSEVSGRGHGAVSLRRETELDGLLQRKLRPSPRPCSNRGPRSPSKPSY
jgi:hypothetical protein